ncbi:MAG: sigma-70 family RNA polymerase sigma factor [Calditrichaeota bacterium]|nr:sigma-70 family RNA polymerase sigma factor [Calditrichota bacterium]
MSESDLIVRAQKGEIQAFEMLVRSYDRKVLGFALRLLKNAEDARDAYQDIFLKAFQALPAFRGKSHFSTWLYQIAYHTCVNYLRKRGRINGISFFSEEDAGSDVSVQKDKHGLNPEEELLQKEMIEEIERIVQTFSPKLQGVFHLRYQNGLPLKEISAITGLSLPAVKHALFRMHEKFRRNLRAYLTE